MIHWRQLDPVLVSKTRPTDSPASQLHLPIATPQINWRHLRNWLSAAHSESPSCAICNPTKNVPRYWSFNSATCKKHQHPHIANFRTASSLCRNADRASSIPFKRSVRVVKPFTMSYQKNEKDVQEPAVSFLLATASTAWHSIAPRNSNR